MWSTLSLLSFPGSLGLTVAAPDRVLSIGQIELFNICAHKKNLCEIELLEIKLFDHLTGCKQMIDI